MLISNKSIPIFFATILFVACSHNTASFTAEDPIEIEKDGCDGVVIPNYSPNIEYLNILDTMFHLGLFDNDTLFIMYDREYQTTDYSHQINGTTIVYLTKEGRVFSQHDSVIVTLNMVMNHIVTLIYTFVSMSANMMLTMSPPVNMPFVK